MHICTVTVALLYICTILQTLIWVFFWLKCVKLTTFCILHNFATSDAVALTFLLKGSKAKIHKFPNPNIHKCT